MGCLVSCNSKYYALRNNKKILSVMLLNSSSQPCLSRKRWLLGIRQSALRYLISNIAQLRKQPKSHNGILAICKHCIHPKEVRSAQQRAAAGGGNSNGGNSNSQLAQVCLLKKCKLHFPPKHSHVQSANLKVLFHYLHVLKFLRKQTNKQTKRQNHCGENVFSPLLFPKMANALNWN